MNTLAHAENFAIRADRFLIAFNADAGSSVAKGGAPAVSGDECRAMTEAWKEDKYHDRPLDALGNRTPSEFARPLSGRAPMTTATG